MHYALLLPIMIFLHIIDDFVVQGILAKMKQRQWWKDQTKHMDHEHQEMYRYDWTVALLAHAFEWSFMIMLPILVYSYNTMDMKQLVLYMMNLCGNTLIHAYIDHNKCNLLVINLITDQSCHIAQIFVTWMMWYILNI